ncbi:phosphatase PAP2 family protein [Aeromicrobium sp.]|uniref:phosphatase PAP2 family protein n=1 Tax=Aeromicrobium sp. TaxID=1871063 RepID=UPI002FC9CDD2
MSESPRPSARQSPVSWVFSAHRIKRGAIEFAFLAVLYVAYSASRLLASDDFAPARGHALDILTFEKSWRIDVESWLNDKFVQYDWLGVFGSFWYATTHYIVTMIVLIWIYRRSASEYVTARRSLALATIIGLMFYLVMPTAPPRLIEGMYVDVMSFYSYAGWWGADASAPKGLGGITNELAAFPSLHAGWALWVALVLIRAGVPKIVQGLGLAYAAMMTIVIIGTGNHWLLDAVIGWIVVLIAFAVVIAWERRSPVTAHEEAHLRRATQPLDDVIADNPSLVLRHEVSGVRDDPEGFRDRER